jgi:predicted MFS family arabinose efflux permease
VRPSTLPAGIAAAVSAVVGAAVFLTVLLTQAKFESHVFALVEDRLAIVLEEAAEPVRFALGLGIGLGEIADLDAILERAMPEGAAGLAIAAYDADGAPIARLPDSAAGVGGLAVDAPLTDGFGRPAGRLTLALKSESLHLRLAETGRMLRLAAAAIAAGVAAIAIPALWLAARPGRRAQHGGEADAAAKAARRRTWRVVGAAGGLMLIGAVAVSALAWRQYAPIVAGELAAQAETLGSGLQSRIGRALEVGIPIDRLVGVEEVFAEELAHAEGIAFLALRAEDRLLYRHARDPDADGSADGDRIAEFPLSDEAEQLGVLQVGIPGDYARRVGLDLLVDVVSVLAVCCLLGVELLVFVVGRTAAPRAATTAGPAAPTADPVAVRLPILLFALGEELSRPFLPLFARELAGPDPWLSEDLATALPISLFMLVWALSQPWGAAWSERAGRRRIFAIGALIGAAGLAATAVADSLAALLACRAVAAVGYGLVLIGAQGLILDTTPPGRRAMGMATLVGGLLAAAVCGPVLGGVLAEQAGPRWAFACGAGLALLAVPLLLLSAPRGGVRPERREAAPKVRWGDAVRLLGTARFAALLTFSAAPTKLAATALLFYLVPLALAGGGAGPADIGRVQTLYFVAFMAMAPLAAWASDRTGRRRAFLAWGGLGTLLAVLPFGLGGGLAAAALSMILFGAAQALISAPQLVLVGDVARAGGRPGAAAMPESVVIAIFRLVERLGAMIAPALAAGLAMAYGYRAALVGIGLLTAVAAVLFLVAFREGRSTGRAEEMPEAP